MLPPQQQAPFVLTAMTLRGVGSYLHGARLEIRPLTILCGKNGSGKSTWLKVLNLLARSLEANKLPFGFDIADWGPENVQLTNGFYHVAPVEEHAKLADPAAAASYGPPGTIGLEFIAARDIAFRETDHYETAMISGHPRDFLWRGNCPAGTAFRIRLAHPTYWSDATATPDLVDLVDLRVDGKYQVSLTGERDPLQQFENGLARPRRAKPYAVTSSLAFLPGSNVAQSDVVNLGSVTDLPHFVCEPRTAESYNWPDDMFLHKFVETLETRLRELLTALFASYFYIGAVRQPQIAVSLANGNPSAATDAIRKRYVGPMGEHAWLLERSFAANVVRQPNLGRFRPEGIDGTKCLTLFQQEPAPEDERLARIWAIASEESRASVRALRATDADEEEAEECIAELLNSVLPRRDLFSHEYWAFDEDDGDGPGLDGRTWFAADPDITHYTSLDIATLSEKEVEHLNYLLIRYAIRKVGCAADPDWTDYRFEDYVSYWMQKLTDTGLVLHRVDPPSKRWWTLAVVAGYCYRMGAVDLLPLESGFLLSSTPSEKLRDEGQQDKLSLERLTHPCFGRLDDASIVVPTTQTPRQMSSGFHQVFPIIVQLGLTANGELTAVENPEVHLHPSLQLQVTEALMGHAMVGRLVFVETHSDLVIRRVIRAILEEELPQSTVRVYFADVQGGPQVPFGDRSDDKASRLAIRFYGSSLTPVEIDERGRIANWPEGFLDEDVRESQRLLDVMYGANDEGDDDD